MPPTAADVDVEEEVGVTRSRPDPTSLREAELTRCCCECGYYCWENWDDDLSGDVVA